MIATVLDTETTGLIINPARKLDLQPEIISISIKSINMMTEELFNEYYRVFLPTKPLSPEITRITGFTNVSLVNAPSIKDHLDEIIARLMIVPLIIGQNVSFDKKMLDLECDRYNKIIKWPPVLDLVENTIHLKGYRLSLTNLHQELFGLGFDGAHRADVDVDITIKCALELFKRGML